MNKKRKKKKWGNGEYCLRESLRVKKGRLCNGKGILELNSILGNYGRAGECLKSGETLGGV